MGPQTLSEAVEYTINGYGEYGEGRKVTSWRSAQRHYRKGKSDTKEAGAVPPKKSEAKPEVADLINWKQLGLGFGGSDVGPRYDDAGKAISGLANTAGLKDRALPLAALQAIAVAAGMGQAADARIPATKVEASKTKTARTLEVKAEARPTESVDLPAFAQPPTTNPRQGGDISTADATAAATTTAGSTMVAATVVEDEAASEAADEVAEEAAPVP
ncbi:hypothetical protein PF010_g22818 [Phytophthora fragariae]|uniref:Uncharacterized protein n=2 Tax=Phytophthora fragariae TaxID=53985 RepID=A0A6G0K7Y0_9STRA|nr:hypothetical protein PF010_g22818 [Phytophthora fragariae]